MGEVGRQRCTLRPRQGLEQLGNELRYEETPVDHPLTLKTTEDGVGPGDGDSCRLLRIENQNQEGEDSSCTGILTIRHAVPFFCVDLARELVLCKLILPSREAGSTRSESVDPLPSLLRP